MSTDRPKVLRKLKIDEFSFCDVPCNADSTVLVWKRGGGVAEAPNLGAGSATSMTEAERVAKAVEDKVNAAADEAMGLLDQYARTRNRATFDKADAILRGVPEVGEAYELRVRGERWTMPVAKADPDHRPAILKLVASRDFRGLEQLAKAHPAAGRQYSELMFSGAFDDGPKAA